MHLVGRGADGLTWRTVARYTEVMDSSSELRNIAKQQYAIIRRELAAFEDRVLARYWDQDMPIRVGFRWFLGSLDQLVGGLTARTVDVTFTLPAEVVATTVALCGDFNGWSTEDTWLERGEDGIWRVTIALEPGRSYRYRYLLDGERWENDWRADRYVQNPYGSTDSVVVVEPDS
jgi:hypothetical protein